MPVPRKLSNEERCAALQQTMLETDGAKILQAQDASAVFIDGQPTSKEHFGYTDGFGNPDFKGAERQCVPGQGKLGKEDNTFGEREQLSGA
jgi:hypothetical protein